MMEAARPRLLMIGMLRHRMATPEARRTPVLRSRANVHLIMQAEKRTLSR